MKGQKQHIPDSESQITVDRKRLAGPFTTEWNTKEFPIEGIKGRLLVGGYLLGDNHYCNKIVAITSDGKNIEGFITNRLLCTDVRFTGDDRLENDLWITVEETHSAAGGKGFNRAFKFSEKRPVIKQFKLSKSI